MLGLSKLNTTGFNGTQISVMHWFIKIRINPDYDHPMGEDAKETEKLGIAYASVFELISYLHTWGLGGMHKSSIAWFQLIIWEFALIDSTDEKMYASGKSPYTYSLFKMLNDANYPSEYYISDKLKVAKKALKDI